MSRAEREGRNVGSMGFWKVTAAVALGTAAAGLIVVPAVMFIRSKVGA